jgi:hypothetical protein
MSETIKLGNKRLSSVKVMSQRPSYQEYLNMTAFEHVQDPVIRAWKRANLKNIMRGLKNIMLAEELGVPTFFGALWLKVIDDKGIEQDFGLASLRVVTTVGAAFLVDAFQGTVEAENMRYHGIGTGTTAESVSDTTLVTELTTQYNPDNTRATGTLAEGATSLIFRTIGTNTVDSTVAITEHGIFSSATSGAGVLLDRSMFAALNLASGYSLQSTYELTLTAGS